MPSVYMTEGRVCLLEQLRALDGVNWYVGLFQTALAPAVGDTFALYNANKATYSGYAALNPAWAAAVAAAPDGRITAPPVTFQHNGGGTANTVYGYYIYHATQNKVLFAESFATPKTMATAADRIDITPTITESTF